jgi:predicted lipid-binding transport protein (Tim44 family)
VTTAEMASYFEEELAANAAKGLVNKVSGGKLLQGDLAEAWREGGTDYATVAMRFEIIDTMVERTTGRIVAGDPAKPELVTEVWTFQRPIGGAWQLSAIQQTG